MSNNIKESLIVSSSPHIQDKESIASTMYIVALFLLPACIFGFVSFGVHSVLVVLCSIVTCILAEVVCQLLMQRPVTVFDGSALLTGLLIGMNLPPMVPFYIPIISSLFAICLVKQAFGGLGQNWANPAIAARVFAFVSWPTAMTQWQTPFSADVITTASPLGAVQSTLLDSSISASGAMQLLDKLPADMMRTQLDYIRLFFGFKAGCIGEISVFLLLLGGLFLLYRKIITWDIPVSYLGSVALLAWIFDGLRFGEGFFAGDPLFHLLTGGLMLGAFFMATDLVTTPITPKGRVIFGIGCGVITMLIRLYGSFPEGVSLAILFMNMLSPTIDRFVKRKPLGMVIMGARK